jgi:hypothetical protein
MRILFQAAKYHIFDDISAACNSASLSVLASARNFADGNALRLELGLLL